MGDISRLSNVASQAMFQGLQKPNAAATSDVDMPRSTSP